jgi:UDP-3-O-[3-hydroxymyristoyl] N-acetylglucosamine deacetylase
MVFSKAEPEAQIKEAKIKADHSNATQSDTQIVRQRTLKNSMSCTGVGLHGGDTVTLTLHPADANTGIHFRRTDLDASQDGDAAIIPARWDLVVDTRLCTVLGNEAGVTIGTVEHVMAALAGCGIDNAVIEVDGPEVPIMDGSSEPFVFLIECAGVVEQDAPRRVIRIHKEVQLSQGDAEVSLMPGDCLDLNVRIDFDSKAVARQELSVGLMNGSFRKELASARTFGFLHEVEQLRAAGLAKGGSLENAIVVSGDEILNEEGLRYDDEFVRHKMLDAVGDLYLAGAPIIGCFNGARSGHAVNNQLLRKLFADETAWSYDVIRGDEARKAVDGGLRAEARGEAQSESKAALGAA